MHITKNILYFGFFFDFFDFCLSKCIYSFLWLKIFQCKRIYFYYAHIFFSAKYVKKQRKKIIHIHIKHHCVMLFWIYISFSLSFTIWPKQPSLKWQPWMRKTQHTKGQCFFIEPSSKEHNVQCGAAEKAKNIMTTLY